MSEFTDGFISVFARIPHLDYKLLGEVFGYIGLTAIATLLVGIVLCGIFEKGE